MLYPFK